MANNYFWEVGIDEAAAQGPDGSSFLPEGLVLRAPDGNDQLASPFSVNQGDTITFMIYDLTSPMPLNISVSEIQIDSAMAHARDSGLDPFGGGSPGTPQKADQQASLMFDGKFRTWSTQPLKASNQGRFKLTFTVIATINGTQRRFVSDPEMVVGPDGGFADGRDLVPPVQRRAAASA